MRNAVILTIELIILIILLALYFIFMPSYFSVNYLGLVIGLSIFSLLIFFFRKVDSVLSGNVITITVIFIVSFIIVHFQFYIDYFLGLRSDLALTYYLDYNIVSKAALISSISLVVFLIGNLLYTFSKKNNVKLIQSCRVQDYSFSFNFLKILVIVFFIIFVFVTPVEYFKGGYHEMMNSGGVGYLQYKTNHFLQVCIWAYIICHTITVAKKNTHISFFEYIKQLKPLFLMILVLYFVLNVLGGDRGPLVVILVMLVAGYFVSHTKKINFKVAIIAIFIGALLLQFIAFFRMMDGSLSLSDRINEALVAQVERKEQRVDNSLFPATTELATSVRAYHAAVMDQEYNDILYGSSNIGYVVSIIPGLGLIIQNITNSNFIGTAEYITEAMGAGHGMGTTVLADTYLNYGFYGSTFVFLFFGYFFAKLDTRAYLGFANNSLIYQILFLLFVSYALVMGRSTFIFVISNVLLVYILIKISMIFKK